MICSWFKIVMLLLISGLILKKKKKKKKVFDNLLFGMCGHGNLSHILPNPYLISVLYLMWFKGAEDICSICSTKTSVEWDVQSVFWRIWRQEVCVQCREIPTRHSEILYWQTNTRMRKGVKWMKDTSGSMYYAKVINWRLVILATQQDLMQLDAGLAQTPQ